MTAATTPPLGVLIAQLGSPDAPTAAALRRYLREFLSDRNVIDYPSWFWQPLLRGVILPLRSPRSARLYERIWMPEGSPLVVHSRRFAAALQSLLGEPFQVELGMRYGQPSFTDALRGLAERRARTVVVFPMFPQSSGTTTGSIDEAVDSSVGVSGAATLATLERIRVPPYYDSPVYLDALAHGLRDHIESLAKTPQHVLVSFHGLPLRYIRRGDPYARQCEKTARRLAERMGWQPSDWSLAYQSRFGPEPWLAPATNDRLMELARKGVRRLLVVAPSFVADCLETISELGDEGKEIFVRAGGDPDGYSVAPSLNADPRWVEAAASLVRQAASAGRA